MSENLESVEKMGEFFDARVDEYDEYMIRNVDGTDILYTKIAEPIEVTEKEIQIIDYGCGTGLELAAIFGRATNAKITGVDLSRNMLAKLREKYMDRKSQIEFVVGSYLDVGFENNRFDYAVSVMTMHHFEYETKVNLYKNILESLKEGAIYIEGDYTATTKEVEETQLAWYKEVRAENHIDKGLYHLDIPFTVETQIGLLKDAGFKTAKVYWQEFNASIIVAVK